MIQNLLRSPLLQTSYLSVTFFGTHGVKVGLSKKHTKFEYKIPIFGQNVHIPAIVLCAAFARPLLGRHRRVRLRLRPIQDQTRLIPFLHTRASILSCGISVFLKTTAYYYLGT